LKTPEAFREMLALTAADLDAEPGRRWRSTADTARAVALVRGGSSWSNWRRGKDYYGDGELLWLDIDTLIRERTHGRASLDDFEKRFLGAGGTTGPIVRTYDLGEIVADLDAIAPYDWKRFFADNVYAIRSRADVDGIVRGGYRLVYDEQPTAAETAVGDPANPLYVGSDFWYSLGLRVDDDGTVDDVRYGGPADAANVAPHERITAVGDAPYTAAVLRAAVHAASGEPIRLTVRQDGETFVIAISYRGGERYPRLVQQRKTPVLLDAIVQPSYR
jgi:predicted metalloprotease with PDZ domain